MLSYYQNKRKIFFIIIYGTNDIIYIDWGCSNFSTTLVLFLYYFPKNNSISSSTVPIPEIPKLSISTLATFSDKKAGSVGPR